MTKYRDTVLTDAPVIYLPFDDGENESIGSSNPGFGSTGSLTWKAGIPGSGGASLINAGSGYKNITITPAPIFNDGSWAIEYWFQKATAGQTGWMENINMFNAGDTNNAISTYGNQATAGITLKPSLWYKGNGATQVRLNGPDINDVNWHHFVGTANGTNTLLYIDGTQVASGASHTYTFAAATSYNFWINAYQASSGAENWTGRFDELAIYSGNLSAARVSAHYAAGLASLSVATSPFIGWGIPT